MDTWVLVLALIGCSTSIYSEYRWRKLFASIIENSEKDAAELGRLEQVIQMHERRKIEHEERIADLDEEIDTQSSEINTLVNAVVERDSKLNGLTGTIEQHQDTIRDHKEQIAERDKKIDGLLARIISTEESYRTKQAVIKECDTAYETLRMNYDQLHAADKLLKRDRDMTTSELTAMTLERDRLLEVIKLRDEKIDKLVARTNELNAQIDGLKYKFETRGGQSPDLNTAWHMKETPVDTKQKYLLDDTPLDENGSGVIDLQPYGE